MIVIFNKENAGILSIPVIKKSDTEKAKKLSNEKSAHVSHKIITLVPGANDIDPNDWNAVLGIRKVKMYLAKGWLVIKGAKKVTNKETNSVKYLKDVDVKDMSAEEQEALIEECYHIPFIKKWKKEGLKDSARAKADARIEKLKNPESEEDDTLKMR